MLWLALILLILPGTQPVPKQQTASERPAANIKQDGANSICSKWLMEPVRTSWPVVLVGIGAMFVAWRTLDDIKKQTKNTEIAALAAKASADAVVNAERAWIMADVDWVLGYKGPMVAHSQDGSRSTTVSTSLKCINDGKTPAWIDEKCVVLKIVDAVPAEPDFSGVENQMKSQMESQIGPEPLGVGQHSKWDIALVCPGSKDFDNFSLLYGVIKYRDAFGKNRQTFFGYCLDLGGKLTRLSGFPQYNRNT